MKIIAERFCVALAAGAGGKAWNRAPQIGEYGPVSAKPSEEQDGGGQKGHERNGHNFERGKLFPRRQQPGAEPRHAQGKEMNDGGLLAGQHQCGAKAGERGGWHR